MAFFSSCLDLHIERVFFLFFFYLCDKFFRNAHSPYLLRGRCCLGLPCWSHTGCLTVSSQTSDTGWAAHIASHRHPGSLWSWFCRWSQNVSRDTFALWTSASEDTCSLFGLGQWRFCVIQLSTPFLFTIILKMALCTIITDSGVSFSACG